MAAKQATRTIPIVMMAVGNPVEQGLVASLAHPGGNVTGVSFSPDLEIFGKGLEFLKEIAPKVRRVAALSNPANPASALGVRDATTAARSLGLQLRVMETRGPNAFDGAFATMAKDRVEALLVLTDPLFILHRAQLADLAAQHRLASVYAVKESVEAGGLMSYGPSLMAAYRRAAVFIDKILKGAKPADLPVEQPTKFELAINLKTAKASASRSRLRCWRGRIRSSSERPPHLHPPRRPRLPPAPATRARVAAPAPLAGLVDGRRADRRGTAPPGVGRSAHAVRRRELARDVFYVTGAAHSIVGGSVWEPTPWRAVQRAAWG